METILPYYIPDHKTPELAKFSQNLPAINYKLLSSSRTFLFREKMFHCQHSGVSFPHITSSESSHRPLLACFGGHQGGLGQAQLTLEMHATTWALAVSEQEWILSAARPGEPGGRREGAASIVKLPGWRIRHIAPHLPLLLGDLENGLSCHAL